MVGLQGGEGGKKNARTAAMNRKLSIRKPSTFQIPGTTGHNMEHHNLSGNCEETHRGKL